MPVPLLYSPGDILFYRRKPGDLVDTLISDITASPFVHVGIAISGMQEIQALFHGVILTAIDPPSDVWSYSENVKSPDPARMLEALAWLAGMCGRAYGWEDIGNALLAKLIHGITIDVEDNLDCSSLATLFLLKAGNVTALFDSPDPHSMTPGMLAGRLGIRP